jgi:7,8-dihydropterin-6-yl-methyl-4-(beta-D-ribofuranosyl)aminobenzene 5'-phosphate synthase
VQIIEERGPTMLIGEHALVTGQIPRTTPYEKGSPRQVALIGGKWRPILGYTRQAVDERKGKGLVVLTGCGTPAS